MSGFPRSSNPFEDEDDEYSFEGYYKSRQNHGSLQPSEADRRQQILTEINDSESRQLASTQRALASIYESESMGVATAEELVRQGETLDNIERRTGEINQTMKTSQRHLNNIKSVFGGIKNWWTGKKQEEEKATQSSSKLQQTLEEHKQSAPHPSIRLRYDTSGFYQDDDDIDKKFLAGSQSSASGGPRKQMIHHVTHSEREEELDKNLAMMSDGMTRLKGLAVGLGDEIDRQNSQLDRINVHVDTAGVTLDDQLTQMRRLQNR